jgi:hypothetical protein
VRTDHSGTIDARELNEVMRQLFPHFSRRQRVGAIDKMKLTNESLVKDDFVDAIVSIHRSGKAVPDLTSSTSSGSGSASSVDACRGRAPVHDIVATDVTIEVTGRAGAPAGNKEGKSAAGIDDAGGDADAHADGGDCAF